METPKHKITKNPYYEHVFDTIEAKGWEDIYFGAFADDRSPEVYEAAINSIIESLDEFFSASGLSDNELLSVLGPCLPHDYIEKVRSRDASPGDVIFAYLFATAPIENNEEDRLESAELCIALSPQLQITMSMNGEMWRGKQQSLTGEVSDDQTELYFELRLEGRLEKVKSACFDDDENSKNVPSKGTITQ